MARRGLSRVKDSWPMVVGAILIITLWQGSVTLFNLAAYVLPGLGAILGEIVARRSILLQGP